MTLANARLQASEWARNILSQDPLILDSETTGLDGRAEICQIAIIDSSGQILLDTLVKPTVRIQREAQAIHGITETMLVNAPSWKYVAYQVGDILSKRPLIIYNADFDTRLMRQSSAAVEDDHRWSLIADSFECAMLAYAKFYGAWNDYRDDWAWQKLDVAMAQQGLDVPAAPAHSALGDCLRTLALVKCMAGAAGEAVPG